MSTQIPPFEPIRTERLIIRCPVMADVDAVYERRRLPEVGRYQDWVMPYTRERAEKSTARCVEMGGPAVDATWNATVVDADDPERILGDLALEMRWEGRVGYFGYTFHPDYWGRGYATEASQALMRYLFHDLGVTRVESELDPRNAPSARVLEACGLLFEGLTRESFWVGDECSSNMLYGMTRADWDAWINRPRSRPDHVELVPVTPENSIAVGRIATHKTQERFVPPMGENFRDALVPPERDGTAIEQWYRAIEADGDIVGFVITEEPGEAQAEPRVLRLLIDRMHQRRGIGTAVMDQVEERWREVGAISVSLSYARGPGTPAGFFAARGYQPIEGADPDHATAVKRLRG